MKIFNKKKSNNALVILASPFYLDKGSSVRARSNVIAYSRCLKVDLISYPNGQDISVDNLKIYRCFLPRYNKSKPGISFLKMVADLSLLIKGVFLLLKHHQHYSVIIGEDGEGGMIAMVLSRLFRIPFIYSMYNSIAETLAPYTKNRIIINIANSFDRKLESSSYSIITEWKYEQERLEQLYPFKNICYLSDAFPPELQKCNVPTTKYICYSGNSKRYQGLDLLLESFEKYKTSIKSDTTLVLVGEISNEFKTRIKSMQFGQDIIVQGRRSLEETNYIIRHSIFCVLPRIIDGPPGMKAMHYFSQGKSILATNLLCNSRMIDDGVTGNLVPMNSQEYAKGIIALERDCLSRGKYERCIVSNKVGQQEAANHQFYCLFQKLDVNNE